MELNRLAPNFERIRKDRAFTGEFFALIQKKKKIIAKFGIQTADNNQTICLIRCTSSHSVILTSFNDLRRLSKTLRLLPAILLALIRFKLSLIRFKPFVYTERL